MLYAASGLGWDFELYMDSGGKPGTGGLALGNVRHAGHNFAKDLRLVAIWFSVDQVDKAGTVTSSKKYCRTLSQSSYFTPGKVRTLEPKPVARPGGKGTFQYLKETDEALNFSGYFKDGENHSAYGVAVQYEAPDLFSKLSLDNCEFAGISVEQIFLFSRYANDPRHEPSAAVTAARFHPIVRYKLTDNPRFQKGVPATRISSIRFDYRLHLFIDPHRSDFETPWTGNQAALFADTDIGNLRAIGRGLNAVLNPFASRPASGSAAFYAVEKPLVLEVTAPGLIKGISDGRDVVAKSPPPHETVVGWDNVHWWGARFPGAELISSPGAFHAAHVHWRWGSTIGNITTPGSASGPQFQPGQPLVDPDIPVQTIRVAITAGSRDPNLEATQEAELLAMTEANWEDAFDKGKPPKTIKDGDDICLWYSAEVHREAIVNKDKRLTSKTGGSVFIHGVFFAHDAEQTGVFVGSRKELYWDRTQADIIKNNVWFRSANK